MLPGYIQVILAVAIVVILFVIGFMVYNYEYLRTFRQQGISKQKVVIFEGVKDLYSSKDEVYHTQDKNNSLYRDIGPSYNQAGGIEYTYNFWMYMSDKFISSFTLTPEADKGIQADPLHQTILFVKGSKNLVTYPNICGVSKTDIQVKSPLVKLEDGGKVMTVEFNTLQGPDAVVENAPSVCSEITNNWSVANAHKLAIQGLESGSLVGKYNMFTIVIQDTFPQDPLPYRNKVRCRVYVNGLLKYDKYADGKLYRDGQNRSTANEFSTLKTNMGNLFVAPNITGNRNRFPDAENKLRLANLSYFNYAITQPEIDSLYSSGYDNKPVVAELNTFNTVTGNRDDAGAVSGLAA